MSQSPPNRERQGTIARKTKVPLEDMIFFDNEHGNCETVAGVGCTVLFTPDGVTRAGFEEALNKFPSPGKIESILREMPEGMLDKSLGREQRSLGPEAAFGWITTDAFYKAVLDREPYGVNALVSADPGPPLGGAVYHDTAVWVRPA